MELNKIKRSVIRWNSVSHIGKAKGNYIIPHTEKCERVVDDSTFVPESEILKKLDSARPLSDVELQQYYDFANGRDNGTPIPFTRSAENLDIAILSKEFKDSQTKLRGEIEEAAEKAERQLKREMTGKAAAEKGTSGN